MVAVNMGENYHIYQLRVNFEPFHIPEKYRPLAPRSNMIVFSAPSTNQGKAHLVSNLFFMKG